MARYLVPLFVFVAIAAFLALGLNIDPKRVPSPLIGKQVPAFELPALESPTVTVNSKEFLGKVSLLNVWASWCVACRDEHDVLLRLKNMGVVDIYGLNYKDKTDDAMAWLEKLGNPYFISASDLNGRVGIDWGVYGVPETFVIDRKGIIRHKVIGPLTDNLVREEILPLLLQLNAEAGS